MKNFFRNILLGAVLLSPFNAFAEINIAVITPMGNDYKYFSEELINGAKIAVDEINNRGGLQGKKINLLPIDDPCDDNLSLSAAQMMSLNKVADNKIYMVIGPTCNNAADDVAELLAKAKILQVHPTSVSKARYNRAHKGIIHFTGYKEEQAKELTRFVFSHYPQHTMAGFYDGKDMDMTSVADTIRLEYEKPERKRNLVLINYAEQGGDIDAAVSKATDGEATLVYILGTHDNIIKTIEKLKTMDSEIVVFADRYHLNKKFARKMKDLSEDSFMMSLPPLTQNPNFASSLVRLRLWGIEPEGLMPYGYLSVKMWSNLVKETKSFKYDKILKQLEANPINTGWDTVTFINGIPEKSLPYVVYRIRDGEYTQVY